MLTINNHHRDVLKWYSRPVVHLRRQFREKRFGPVVGAGISLDFNVPLWGSLVEEIAKHPKVNGQRVLAGHANKKSFPFQTELLFQLFRANELKTLTPSLSSLEKENTISARWLTLCGEIIYANAHGEFGEALEAHGYFKALLPLVQNSYLTVNFNFDDYLERALNLRKRTKDESNRGYEVVMDPWPQFRRTDSVIYHLHGFVPFGLMELPVDRLVFSEAEYSKQYVGSRGHDSSFLIGHFARNTCLLLGCSLEDELRNVLMRGAQMNPGNYHYYIHYVHDATSKPDEKEQELISATNFNVYNLITLFLSSSEISALLELINDSAIADAPLKDLATELGVCIQYNFYMTGPLGVGKSTTANNLRNLVVLDEWLEVRPPILGKPWDKLNDEERDEVDSWIADQFYKKNNSLRHIDGAGAIAIVDRPPLVPLVFTEPARRPAKAKSLLDKICPSRKWSIEPGVVIILTGDTDELSARVRASGREDYSADRLKKMQEAIIEIYTGDGIEKVDTRYLSVREVTKLVAQIVHRQPYKPYNLQAAMLAQESAENDPPKT